MHGFISAGLRGNIM